MALNIVFSYNASILHKQKICAIVLCGAQESSSPNFCETRCILEQQKIHHQSKLIAHARDLKALWCFYQGGNYGQLYVIEE